MVARSKRGRGQVGWFRAVGRYYRDPTASFFGKLIAVLAAVYVVMPVDLIPDVPIVGWLDDIGVFGLAMTWLTRRIAAYREPPLALDAIGGAGALPPSRKPFSVSP